jgi:copper chaperone
MASNNRRTLTVTGMTCGGCARSVERALSRVKGAERVVVDLATGRAEIDGTAATEALVAAVEAAGYGVEASAS